MKHPEKENQKDLFGLPQEAEGPGTPETIRSFFRIRSSHPLYSISLEQILVALIVLLILFVLVFMMGVVRGRSGAVKLVPLAPTNSAAPAAVAAPRPESNIVPKHIPQPAVANTAKKPYTIQLVTYRNEDRALREIADLKTKGLDARLVPRSGYYEICVGQYANRKEAQKDLRVFGIRYKGCYLRKV